MSVLLAWPLAECTDLVKCSHLTSPTLRCLLALISFLPSPSRFFLALCFPSFCHWLLSSHCHPFLHSWIVHGVMFLGMFCCDRHTLLFPCSRGLG